jgi:uncharacterized protein YkuJ
MKVTVDVPYEIDEEVIITVQDAHIAGDCNKGMRRYFERNGWDWSDFIKNGKKVKDVGFFDEFIRPIYEEAVKRNG